MQTTAMNGQGSNSINHLVDLFSVQGTLNSPSELISAAQQAGCSQSEAASFFLNNRTIVETAVHHATLKKGTTIPPETRMAEFSTDRHKSLTQLAGMLDAAGGIRDALSVSHLINFARTQKLNTVRCGIMRVIAATRQPDARARLDSSDEVALFLEMAFIQAYHDGHATVALAALQALASMQLGKHLPISPPLRRTVQEASTDRNIRVAAAAVALLGQWDWLESVMQSQQQQSQQPQVAVVEQQPTTNAIPQQHQQQPAAAAPASVPTLGAIQAMLSPTAPAEDDRPSKKTKPQHNTTTATTTTLPTANGIHPNNNQQQERLQPPQQQQQSNPFNHIPKIAYLDSIDALGTGEEGQAAADLDLLRQRHNWPTAYPDPVFAEPVNPPPPEVVPFVPTDQNEFEEQNMMLLNAGVRLPTYVRLPAQ